ETGGRCGHSAAILGENRLVTQAVRRLHIALDVRRQRGLSDLVDLLVELLIRPLENEAYRSSAGRGVVDDLRDQPVLEIELVAYPNFSRGVYDDIPESTLGIELAKEKDLDPGAGFFLVPIEARRK